MKSLTTLLLALTGVTTTGCVATVGGNECSSERCADDDGGSGSSTARDCSDESKVKTVAKNLTIDSDSDLDSLPSEAKGCWALDGVLRIESDKVTSLEKLGDLVNVNDIEIVDTKLAALDFVQDQVEVFGHVRVQGNAKLTSLSPLRASRYTGTVSEEFVPFYVIDNNAELTTIGGLKYLTESTDQLTFTNNPKLTSIELPELTKVTGTGTFQVTGNGITTLTVSSLATVTSIDISQNPQLTNVSGLRVTLITGGIQFKNNPKLSSIGSMGSLTHIGGNLVVDDNDALSDLGGLTSSMQKVVGSVTVTGNQTLSNLGQLSRLSQGINGTVSVMNNPVLGYCAAWELDRCVASGAVTNTGNGNTQTNCPHWCP